MPGIRMPRIFGLSSLASKVRIHPADTLSLDVFEPLYEGPTNQSTHENERS